MQNPRILLVEDNQDDILLTRRALQRANIASEIIVASDGYDALEYLNDDNTPLPVLILLDLKMPRMDGFEFLNIVRQEEKYRYLPIVILTSSGEDKDIIECYKCGANSFIQKPVDFDQFVRTVETLGRYWLIMNKTPRS